MLKKLLHVKSLFVALIVISTIAGVNLFYKSDEQKVVHGSFHISQYLNGQWEDKYDENYSVTYQTKEFQLTPRNNQVKVRINQNKISYGDIEFVQLRACGKVIKPKYARYVHSGENVLEDILYDDHNVAINHENPIELLWNIPEGCNEKVSLSMKANQYESPESQAFRFPDWGTSSQKYMFQNNGSLDIDGLLSEVDGRISPNYSPFWTSGTGHPSNNTYIYIKDDVRYVYLAIDITLDNTNELGHDWLKIFVQNTRTSQPIEYRVDDFNNEFGRCSFGLTSKVLHKHQTCEIRIPKSELKGNNLDFILRYYGTSGGPEPHVSVTSPSFDSTADNGATTYTGTAIATDGAGPITQVGYGLYNNTSSTTIVADYVGVCTANDGSYNSNSEPFTCTTAALSPAAYGIYIEASDGTRTGVASLSFTVTDSIAPSLTLTAITDPTTDTTPSLTGTTTDVLGTIDEVEFQMDGTGGSWSSCIADDGTFDEASETFTCTPSELSLGTHTMYVRTSDNTGNVSSNSTDEFTIAATPTATPTQSPTATPAPNNSNSETIQIPQGAGGDNTGGAMPSIKDSYTFGQRVFSIIEPNTLTFNAFLSARAIVSSFLNNVLPNPMTNAVSKSKIKTNAIYAGGTHLGIKTTGGIYWQIGNIQNIWYKAYPPIGSSIEPAKIIPDLQKKPSIITLSYTDNDLIPPGRPKNKFNAKNLKLATSIDGVVWKLLPTSVVDSKNKTVSALHKIGGYYVIVAK